MQRTARTVRRSVASLALRGVLVAAAAWLPAQAFAQQGAWPSRPVRVVVPFGPGAPDFALLGAGPGRKDLNTLKFVSTLNLGSNENQVTWLAGLNYKPNDNTLIYGKVSTVRRTKQNGPVQPARCGLRTSVHHPARPMMPVAATPRPGCQESEPPSRWNGQNQRLRIAPYAKPHTQP